MKNQFIRLSGMFIGIGGLALLVCTGLFQQVDEGNYRAPITDEATIQVILTTIYDNYQVNSVLSTSWGLGCVVQTGHDTILFDTGGDGSILLKNMGLMGIQPTQISKVVLSHIHGDHVGGLSGFLAENPDVTVYIPASFPQSFRETIRSRGANYKDIQEPGKIARGMYSTGELGTGIREQSLIINTPEGIVVMTGCAHPGIVHIVKRAKNLFPEQTIRLVMGGFHLGGASRRQLQEIIASFQELGVQKVAPSHCSGDLCRQLMSQAFAEDFIENGVGGIIMIPEKR